MEVEPAAGQPTRQETDRSLNAERTKTDDTLERQQASVHEHASEAIEAAREGADLLLKGSRDRADATLTGPPQAEAREDIKRQRVGEDDALHEERAEEDAALDQTFMHRRLLLQALLGSEREATDRHLSLERSMSDSSLGTRDDILGMVAHDLRNMITSIALTSGILLKQAPDKDTGGPTMRMAARIQHTTARMARLVGDLVDITSIEAGKLAVESRPNDLLPLIGEAVAAAQPLALEHHIALHADIHDSALLAKYDGDRTLQVLANLLSNALKFTRDGGKVTIHAKRLGDGVVQVSVTDTGVGIPKEKLEVIFGRFQQAGALDRRGLGLGLFISRNIVEAQGGKIWAESEFGRGSTFRFTLPS
jgi:signal transduction histidine kinase